VRAASAEPARARPAILLLTGGLQLGGVERYVVTLANHLPRDEWEVHLCTTRIEGPLAADVAPDVGRLQLARRASFDLGAVRRLAAYVRRHQIRLIHAHGSALYFGALAAAAMRRRGPVLVWHDHYGNLEVQPRSRWLHRIATLPVDGIISVTEDLARWARDDLRFDRSRVWYLRNFVSEPAPAAPPPLPGSPQDRVVCVANLRPEKAQHRLVEAMQRVLARVPDSHLLLVGNENDPAYADRVRREIAERGLEGHVHVLGPRTDVPAILQACAVGVLGSDSEGLPMALIEYGMARLAAVTTDVGQCGEVVDGGNTGLLVPAGEVERMAEAIALLLVDRERRRDLAERLARRVRDEFGTEAGVRRIGAIYRELLAGAQR
jgi:glycosyltransferase involved in cell wall biosynthesis